MGVGGALCALIAALVSLTLLPALLGALGPRVNALSPRRWQEAIAPRGAGPSARLLVPALAARDAPPGAGRGRRRGAADRARAAVPADRVHRRRRERAARATSRRAWSTTRSSTEFPPSRDLAGLRRRRAAAPAARGRALRARLGRCPASPVAPPRGRRRLADRPRSRPGRRSASRPRSSCATCGRSPAPFAGPRRRRRPPRSSTSRRRCATRCRSRSAILAPPRSSSCS